MHSERTSQEARAVGAKLYGIQAWVALPRSHEEGEPTFTHYGEESLPVLGDRGVRLRLIAGEALGARSPVSTPMAMIYADVQLEAGASVPFDPTYEERGLYTVSGVIEIAGDRFGPGQLLVFRPGDRITVRAVEPARFMLLGGDPMDGPRHIWWNFVSSRPGADRAGESRLEGRALRQRAGRYRIHSSAGAGTAESRFLPVMV